MTKLYLGVVEWNEGPPSAKVFSTLEGLAMWRKTEARNRATFYGSLSSNFFHAREGTEDEEWHSFDFPEDELDRDA